MKKIFGTLFCFLFAFLYSQDAHKDKGEFIEKKTGFYQEIKDSLEEYYEDLEASDDLRFKVDLADVEIPEDTSQFIQHWHFPPVSQGRTGTCWCFAGTSFLESEIYRQTGIKVRMSEMHTVYWETVEKAKRFVRERGDSEFSQGSQFNAVTRIWNLYGAVPLSAYPGKKEDQPFHDHRDLWNDMTKYLETVEETNAWNETTVIQTIRSILDHYLGSPPEYVKVNGVKLSPEKYLKRVLKINMNDYINFMSLMEKPYGKFTEYDVPDNWWNSEEYLNLPLGDFVNVLKQGAKAGYTIGIGGDTSEAGLRSFEEVAIVPTFDIPSEYIDENARQFRFSNRSTTDDHGIHIVGYTRIGDEDWFLIKDSGAGGHNGPTKGYFYYHEDYIKLKMMSMIIHKDAVKDIIKKYLNY